MLRWTILFSWPVVRRSVRLVSAQRAKTIKARKYPLREDKIAERVLPGDQESGLRFLVDKSRRRYYGTPVTHFYAPQLRRRRVIGRWSQRIPSLLPVRSLDRKCVAVIKTYLYGHVSRPTGKIFIAIPRADNSSGQSFWSGAETFGRNALAITLRKGSLSKAKMLSFSFRPRVVFQITRLCATTSRLTLLYLRWGTSEYLMGPSTNPCLSFAPPQTPRFSVRLSQSQLRWII